MPKIQKILIAYDGSVHAKSALASLKLAGLDANAQARVLTVSDLWIPPVEAVSNATDFMLMGTAQVGQQSQEALKEAGILSREGVRLVRKEFPGWKVSAATALDAPAQGILHFSEKWKPSLIILGAQGHTLLERVLTGSVSSKVLKHASCNVRIVRPSTAHKSALQSRVLLAVDGSKDADAMVECVARRSWGREAEFRVVVVLDYRLSLIQDFQSDPVVKGRVRGIPFQGHLSERLAEQAVCALAERGLTVTSAVREGDPRVEVIKEIKRFKANNLFLGRRGLHAVLRFFLGGVSSALAEHSPCTVEVVHR